MKDQIELLKTIFSNIEEERFSLVEKRLRAVHQSKEYFSLGEEIKLLDEIYSYLRKELLKQFKHVEFGQDILDELYDSILSHDDGFDVIPKGYEIEIISSRYIVNYKAYYTIGIVKGPSKQYKPMLVLTYSRANVGQIIKPLAE